MARREHDHSHDHDREERPKHRPSRSHPRYPDRHGAPRRGLHYGVGAFGYFGLPTYGLGTYQGVQGVVSSTNHSSPPPVGVPNGQGHLNPEQFVGYPGGFETNAGNYTGAEALAGAAGNGGAGGDGAAGGGGSA